jgi:hypothetical protein
MGMNPRLLRPTASGFDPRRIAGISAWYDASVTSSVTIATGVSQWNDLSGNNRHVFQSTGNNQPAYTGVIGGKPALSFDGSNDNLLTASAVQVMGADYGMSIFCVATRNSGTTITAQDDFTSPRPWSLRARFGSNMTYFHGANSVSVSPPDNSDPFVGTVQQSGAGVSIRYNGGTFATSATAPPATQFNKILYIGSLAATNYFGSLLAELIFYARELTTSERQAVERYLGKKWGITVT